MDEVRAFGRRKLAAVVIVQDKLVIDEVATEQPGGRPDVKNPDPAAFGQHDQPRAVARKANVGCELGALDIAQQYEFSVPPGYVRRKSPFRPKLEEFICVIDAILAADKDRPKKQRHTSKRIFERLRNEHGFTGRITIVKDYVAGWRQRGQEMFVPLVHPPGHAQADFGEALGVIGGVERKIHYLAMDLPHSDAIFVVAYPAETTEAKGVSPPMRVTVVAAHLGVRELPVVARQTAMRPRATVTWRNAVPPCIRV